MSTTEEKGIMHPDANSREDWWLRAKFYELYIDKFTGDIPGLTARLDYFSKLGINCLHLLPHYPSPMDDEGYDVTDYRGVRPELGTTEDLRQLFAAARERGIRVIIDLVLNHVSTEHPWFREARQSETNEKRDYFLWSKSGNEYEGSPNPFSDFKRSNWIPNEETKDFYFSTFKTSQADLNWHNPKVLHEILDVIDYWVGQGASGFRLDAAAHLIKREGTTSKDLPETHAVLKRIRAHMDLHHPEAILLAEVAGRMNMVKTYFGDDDECHLVYNFELAAELIYALRTGDFVRLPDVLESARDIPPRSSWAAYLTNHDEMNLGAIEETRRHVLIDLLDPAHRYPFKVGQGTSRRLMSAFSDDHTLVKEAFHFLYSAPFATVMYYGDEIGMKNLILKDDEEDSRLAVRGEFEWEEAQRQMTKSVSLWNSVARIVRSSPLPTAAALPSGDILAEPTVV